MGAVGKTTPAQAEHVAKRGGDAKCQDKNHDSTRGHGLAEPQGEYDLAHAKAGWRARGDEADQPAGCKRTGQQDGRSEEHTSELQSLMRISYAVFCLKKKKNQATSTKR